MLAVYWSLLNSVVSCADFELLYLLLRTSKHRRTVSLRDLLSDAIANVETENACVAL
jgi:hypothetical protein